MKTVSKPWGHEEWLAYPPDFPYVMKQIFTKSGSRSSVHVHKQKQESNYVIGGIANVYTGTNPNDMSFNRVGPGGVFHVLPGTVHRVVAVGDLTTIEVSTPEVDDVIRLADDTGRGDGRIESEHV